MDSGAVDSCPPSRWLAQRKPNVKVVIFILDALAEQCRQGRLMVSRSDYRQVGTRVEEEKRELIDAVKAKGLRERLGESEAAFNGGWVVP